MRRALPPAPRAPTESPRQHRDLGARWQSLGAVLALALLVGLPGTAAARHLEAGDLRLGLGVGPGVNMGGSRLAASAAYFLFDLQGGYAIDTHLTLVLDAGFGVSDVTLPLRIRAGVQYHLTELELDIPLSPYFQGGLSVSELFGVLGADLTHLGVRLGVGADYFLTAEWGVGAFMGVDVGSTLGQTPAFYGTYELLVYATYTFNVFSGTAPAPE